MKLPDFNPKCQYSKGYQIDILENNNIKLKALFLINPNIWILLGWECQILGIDSWKSWAKIVKTVNFPGTSLAIVPIVHQLGKLF